jgi:predicted ATPase
MFLEAFRRRRGAKVDDAFPWTVPALRGLRELRFTSPVTFLMGENGCGKSTLLEAIAVATEADAMLHDDNASRRGLGAHITRSSRDVLVRKYGADPHARSTARRSSGSSARNCCRAASTCSTSPRRRSRRRGC